MHRRNDTTCYFYSSKTEKTEHKSPYKSLTKPYNGRVMVGRYVRDESEIYNIPIFDRKNATI